MKALTGRQSDALRFINGHLSRFGYAPTYREIAAAMGIKSTNGVRDHLNALERAGYVRTFANKARAIVVLRCEDAPGTNWRACT